MGVMPATLATSNAPFADGARQMSGSWAGTLVAMNDTRGLADQCTFIVLLATLTTLVPYAFSAAAQLLLLATGPYGVPRRAARP